MNVKCFEGPSMGEAMAKVKQEWGQSAVILRTRSYRRGGVMGFLSRQVVEITAGRNVNIQPRRSRTNAPAVTKANGDCRMPASGRSGTAQAESARDRAALFASRNVVRNAYNTRPPAEEKPSSAESNLANTRNLATVLLKTPAFEFRNEIAGLRTMVESLLQRTSRLAGERPDLPGELAKSYLTLIQQQVADELADRVVDDLKTELTPEEIANPAALRERLVGKLAALIPAKAPASVARPATGTGCRSICLIGPTGVGKTTTIAKLAAAFKLRQKQNIGLITIDTYRIAAVDQLRTYANIIGVPLKVVLTPAELVAALQEMRDFDAVLIDTAGRSPADDLKLNELSGFIKAANPSEVHLVLSSTCTQPAMESALKKFGDVRVDQIIFTKLDEAVSFGVLLNVARKASKALSYITTGQDVPDHVEVGQPRRLAKLILGDKL